MSEKVVVSLLFELPQWVRPCVLKLLTGRTTARGSKQKSCGFRKTSVNNAHPVGSDG